MKGQFMLISSIIVGIIVISATTSISEVQTQDFQAQDISDKADMIRNEVKKVDQSSQEEIDQFKEMVDMISGYSTETTYWSSENCFNVTIRSSSQQASLNCIS